MKVRAHDSGHLGELRAVELENESLRLTVLPELGAKIYDIIHKGKNRNVLWHNPRVRPRKVPFGSRFDDVWSGGWDEIFPNDAEVAVGSEHYPDMGEAWPLEWDYQTDTGEDSVTLTTTVQTPITPAEFRRELTLKEGESAFSCDYTIRNLSRNEISFLWKIHPAFEINGDCAIEIPAEKGLVDSRYLGPFAKAEYKWPIVGMKDGKDVDVSRVDPDANNCTLHYVTGLKEGTARFVDRKNGLVSTIRFPHQTMDNVWLFLAYGGWRGVYTAVIEPSTSYPYDLGIAAAQNHISRLKAGGKLSASLKFDLEEIGSGKKPMYTSVRRR